MIDLRTLAVALGGKVTNGQVSAPGPGHKPGDFSLSVRPADNADGFIVNSFSTRDDWRDCKEHVLRCLGRSTQSRPAPKCHIIHRSDDIDDGGMTRARIIWDQAGDARGTIVERYLESRGLALPECGTYAIRFHPTCPWERGRMPCMVAAFRSIANDRIVTGIHRTALTPEGAKIDRKMLGRARDAAIMLDPDAEVTTSLAVAEGIESGLAGRLLGWRPCWTLGSAGAIAKFPVLSGIECLNILAELGDGGANARAIQEVGSRWTACAREVLIISPRHGGDANDALRSCA